MTDKDPKDMTASELLREAADSIREGVNCRGTRFTSGDSIDELRKMLDLDPKLTYADDMVCALSNLSDKIYAEMAESKESGLNTSLRYGAELWAKANGWPDFREGEDFGAWLDRCFLPRPRFEDGEPVHIGDKAYHPYTGETCTIDCINTFDESYCLGFVEERSAALLDGERVKRPAPEALGADGLPIKVGETVWLDEEHSRYAGSSGSEDGNEYSLCGIERQEMLTVEDAHHEVCGREYIRVDTCSAWCHASWLTHTPPDTQERIDGDALKSCVQYWGCNDFSCGKCPALIDGKKPVEFYELDPIHDSCHEAQKLDLLRRQRELDKRTGGE